eukprot:7384803-Prymnesium_polylepis.3
MRPAGLRRRKQRQSQKHCLQSRMPAGTGREGTTGALPGTPARWRRLIHGRCPAHQSCATRERNVRLNAATLESVSEAVRGKNPTPRRRRQRVGDRAAAGDQGGAARWSGIRRQNGLVQEIHCACNNSECTSVDGCAIVD